MNNEITIKDLPMSYLLKQDSSFFNSTEFNDHVSLFNSIKQNAPLNTNITPLPDLDSSLKDFIKVKLLDYYSDGIFTINSENEEYSFLYLSVKNSNVENEEELVDIKLMDKSTFDLPNRNILIKQVLRNENEIRLKYLSQNALANIDYSTINNIIPESTLNPVYDITKLVDFYNSQQNPNAIYQGKLENILLNNIITSILSSGSLTEYIERNNYLYKNKLKKKELKKLLKESLLARYSSNFNITNDLSIFNKPFIESTIDTLIDLKSISNSIITFDINNQSTITLIHNQNKNHLRFIVIDSNNQIITPLSFNNIDLNSVEFNFNSNITGKIYLYFTDDLSIKESKQKYNLDYIIYKNFVNKNSITLYHDELLKGFVYEIYNNNSLIQPNSITVLNDKVTFNFSTNLNLKIFLIPNVLINTNLTYFNLNEETIDNFLVNEFDINKRYTFI